MQTRLQKIARLVDNNFSEALDYAKKVLPSGSGIDRGVELDESSSRNRIVLNVPFHHMDEYGYYCGWTHYRVIIKPDLVWGHYLKVTGRDRNQIKEYLNELFNYELSQTA